MSDRSPTHRADNIMREILPKENTSTTHGVTRSSVCEGITKRSQVSVACHSCRRRKVKCDDRRPKCTPCQSSNEECSFPMSRFGRVVNFQELPYTEQRYQSLLTVIELIRVAEGQGLEELLRQIRSAKSVHDFLDSVDEAALLLPLNDISRSNDRGQTNSDER